MSFIINKLSEIHGIHKGKKAFIIGAGPSLNDFDLSKINKETDIILAGNQSVTALKEIDYFCIADRVVPEMEFFKYGADISNKIIFCFDNYVSVPVIEEKYYNKSYFFVRKTEDPYNLCFNVNDNMVIAGADISHIASHLAYIMGCSSIILVGVDLNIVEYCKPTEFKKEVIWPVKSISADNFKYSYIIWEAIKIQNPNINFMIANPKSRLKDLFEVYK
jgi:hypothetical protein